MVEQAQAQIEKGRFAFYVPLESLDREPMTGLFLQPERERFDAWKADEQEPAWFFLDAVDELKLTKGRLDRALLRFSRDIDGHIARARVVVSSRPSDWRSSIDLATVQSHLSAPEKVGEIVEPEPDKAFSGALQRERAEPVRFRQTEQGEQNRDGVFTVKMLPMTEDQIAHFAKGCGVPDAAAFVEEIARQNAWGFARRPLDLTDLVANWMRAGRLGTRAEQHEANASTKLKDDPERADHDVLTDSQARYGAEWLALGLALTRTQTIRAPEQAVERDPRKGVLEAQAILPDWTEAQRQTLLRRALFDPATYGRIRFHHRSVQEYLAACCLRGLRERDMSTSALFRLLFAELHGVEVVRPSMRAIAAWLALWDGEVRSELIEREPEMLLSDGDPGTLEIEARGKLLRAFVAEYGHGGWRGLDIGAEEVHRLSHPELASVVRECWQEGSANPEVGAVLLETIRHGPIVACADLARSAALDSSADDDCRIAAVRALIACGQNEAVCECVSTMLVDDGSWPEEVVCHVAADLFPGFISAGDLVKLMEDRHDPEPGAWSFNWVSQHIAKTVEPWSEPAVALRDGMADLIWRRRDPEQEPYHIRGELSYLAPPLATLCDRQLSGMTGEPEPNLIRACVVASRFGSDEVDVNKALSRLRGHFEEHASRRSAGFWQELAFMDEIAPANDGWNRFYYATRDGILGRIREDDRPWLETALGNEERPDRRVVALHAVIDLWRARGGIRLELKDIRQYVKGDEILLRVLADCTAPPKDDEHHRQVADWRREHQRRQQEQAEREEERLKTWDRWREELKNNPDGAFCGLRLHATVYNIHLWLRERSQDRHRFNTWDKAALIEAFGLEIAERAEAAFRTLWRAQPPVLWSARPADARNSYPHDWIQGLAGVSAESSKSGWSSALSSEEARTAAAFATIEMNGFAPFLADLAKSHPSEVEEVVGGEVSAEIGLGFSGDEQHLPTLQNLGHADSTVKRLLVPRLLAELVCWPDTFTDESGSRWLHLERVLRVLRETEAEQDRAVIAQECRRRYEADQAGPLALMWLRGLFQFDPRCGARVW